MQQHFNLELSQVVTTVVVFKVIKLIKSISVKVHLKYCIIKIYFRTVYSYNKIPYK